jgi:hypothetical protein
LVSSKTTGNGKGRASFAKGEADNSNDSGFLGSEHEEKRLNQEGTRQNAA